MKWVSHSASTHLAAPEQPDLAALDALRRDLLQLAERRLLPAGLLRPLEQQYDGHRAQGHRDEDHRGGEPGGEREIYHLDLVATGWLAGDNSLLVNSTEERSTP